MKISSLRLFAAKVSALAIVVMALPEAAGCGLQWSLPKAHFDGVDEQGHVLYAETIGTLDLGDDTTIPLHIMFKSNWNLVSPFLGKGWMLPALESRMVQLDEGRYVLWQPDGWYRMFGRSKEDSNILNGQGGWKAQIQGDSITAWAPCGMKLCYTKGKIMSLDLPPKKDAATARGRKLDYVYRDGRLTGLRLDGAEKLSVDTDVGTGVVRALVFRDGKRVGIEQVHGSSPLLGDRAVQGVGESRNACPALAVGGVHGSTVSAAGGVPDVAGQAGLSTTERTLKLTLADGAVRTYQFGVNAKRQPTLRIGWVQGSKVQGSAVQDSKVQGSEVHSSAIAGSGGNRETGIRHTDGGQAVEPPRLVTWDAETRRIIQDGDWTYEIRADAKNPEANAAIGRKNSQGQTEFFHHDDARGMETVQGADGVRTARTWFVSGKFAGKLRKVELFEDGKVVSTRVIAYDEEGRKIRETLNRRLAYCAVRDKSGRLISEAWPPHRTVQYAYNDDGVMIQKRIIADELTVVLNYSSQGKIISRTSNDETIYLR